MFKYFMDNIRQINRPNIVAAGLKQQKKLIINV